MSCVCDVRGSASSSAHESRIGFSTSPETKKSHVVRSVRGMELAWSTGHLSVRYWPGGGRVGPYPASITFRSALPGNTGATLLRAHVRESARADLRPHENP